MLNTPYHFPSILVLGAGELGLSVLRALSQQRPQQPETQITVLLKAGSVHSTSAEKLARLEELSTLGVKTLVGDLHQQSIEELAELFRPFDTVINCSGFVGGAGTQLKITQAVLDAGIKRYFPWQFGVDYDAVGKGSGQQVWDEQLEVRHLLRAQHETEWVIVSTGLFTSYLFEPSFGVVDARTKTVFALGDWQNAVTVTTPEDIGRLTAKIFFHQPRLRNQAVYLAGDTLSWQRLAELMEQKWAAPVTKTLLSMDRLREEAETRPDDAAAKYRLAFARKTGIAWDKSTSYNAREGVAVTDVEQWLAALTRSENR